MAMFQNDETTGEHEYEMTVEAETVIGSSVKLDGDFHSENDAVIHGHVSGKVEIGGDLTLGGTSIVKANVAAANVVIAGTVQGNVSVRGKLTLLGTAHVSGDISAARLEISEGAMLNGHCSMQQSSEPAEPEMEDEDGGE